MKYLLQLVVVQLIAINFYGQAVDVRIPAHDPVNDKARRYLLYVLYRFRYHSLFITGYEELETQKSCFF